MGRHLFEDAVKKAMLIHLDLFSSPVRIRTLSVVIDDNLYRVFDRGSQNKPPVYSLVTEELVHHFSDIWSDEAVQGLLSQTKTKHDSRTAALYALICSKSKIYESERFIFLWMSFNGMYNYFSYLVAEAHDKDKQNNESIQLSYI